LIKIKEKDTYTVEEFARKMGKHPATVYDWITQKKIPFQKASGIRIPIFEADLLREIGILTGKEISVNWECMKEYIFSLKDTLENVLERKGRGQVIKEIAELIERRK
jgi:excisionase family DNA binding protein